MNIRYANSMNQIKAIIAISKTCQQLIEVNKPENPFQNYDLAKKTIKV